jgi:hypothetical protein
VRLTVARDLADHLDPGKALGQEAQRFLELDERDRPSETQVTPRAEIEDGARPSFRLPNGSCNLARYSRD